jgi:hypothetical protein
MYLHEFWQMAPCSCRQRQFAFPRSLALRSMVATVRLRAGARSLHIRCAVAVASSSRGQRRRSRIINKFIWIRSAQLDSSSRRQLEQQRLCCSLKCLGAVRCQWSTSRRQRNDVDEQINNASRSIWRPLVRKRSSSWISRSTYTPKFKHRKSPLRYWSNLKMAKYCIRTELEVKMWNRERCGMLTCNCFATFKISTYRKNSLRK